MDACAPARVISCPDGGGPLCATTVPAVASRSATRARALQFVLFGIIKALSPLAGSCSRRERTLVDHEAVAHEQKRGDLHDIESLRHPEHELLAHHETLGVAASRDIAGQPI